MSDRDAPARPEPLKAAVEAVVFAAGEPVGAKEIASALGEVSERDVLDALEEIERNHDEGGGGLRLERIAGGFRFATRPEVGAWVRRFFRHRNRTRLSPAALETLAIVAYRQPITMPEIQAIRSVDPGAAVKNLLDKNLVRPLGRKKVIGNPWLYGTTKQFLVHFGLDSLEDLPSIEEFDEVLGALEQDTEPDARRRTDAHGETEPAEAPGEEPDGAAPAHE